MELVLQVNLQYANILVKKIFYVFQIDNYFNDKRINFDNLIKKLKINMVKLIKFMIMNLLNI